MELTREDDEAARKWWKEAIEQMVENRFPALLESPTWVKLLKKVSSGTEADMFKELKDYSSGKVNNLLRISPAVGAAHRRPI